MLIRWTILQYRLHAGDGFVGLGLEDRMVSGTRSWNGYDPNGREQGGDYFGLIKDYSSHFGLSQSKEEAPLWWLLRDSHWFCLCQAVLNQDPKKRPSAPEFADSIREIQKRLDAPSRDVQVPVRETDSDNLHEIQKCMGAPRSEAFSAVRGKRPSINVLQPRRPLSQLNQP